MRRSAGIALAMSSIYGPSSYAGKPRVGVFVVTNTKHVTRDMWFVGPGLYTAPGYFPQAFTSDPSEAWTWATREEAQAWADRWASEYDLNVREWA